MIKKLDINFIKSELKKIQNLFAAGNFEKVIEKTQILLKKDPTQTPFYNFIGLAYKQLNNLEMAKSVFISGLKIRNDSPSILCNLGTVYRATEEFDKAEEVFSRALKLHPKNLSVLVNYANLKSDLNKIDEAIDLYNAGFRVNNNHETLLINYAGAFQIKGDFEKSKESGQKATSINPNDPRVISVYGEALLRLRELDSGIEYLEKAYELDPIPQGQTTSDRRLAALFLGYYLKEDFEKCQAINAEILNIDVRTWLLNFHLHQIQSIDCSQDNWFIKGIKEFDNLDWKMEIDRFHLNNDELNNELMSVVQFI